MSTKRNYIFGNRLIACVLFGEILLQSCGGLLNQDIFDEKKKKQELKNIVCESGQQTEIQELVKNKFTTEGWKVDSFYENQGKLKVKARERHGNFTSKLYDFSIGIDQDIDLGQLSHLGYKQKQTLVHIQPQQSRVVIFRGGLRGGMRKSASKVAGDQREEDEREKGKEEKIGDEFDKHQLLLEIAIEGDSEAQFKLGERAYYTWLYQYRKEAGDEAKIWLGKAARQGHKAAINLLDKVKDREQQVNLDADLQKLLESCERLNFNKLLPIIFKQEIQIHRDQYLGSGSFGRVFQATYQGKSIAVKELPNCSISQFAAFQKEAIIMANHPHSNLVSFLGFYPQENCLLMEYVPGGSLWSLLKNKTQDISWQDRYQIALDVAEGLSYLHDRDIVHCDLKSENILIDSSKRAKITDFGVSALKSINSTHGTWGGTYCWAAPETFITDKNSKAADVYSYGLVLWQLGARRIPFEAYNNNAYQIAKYIIAGNREKISVLS